MSTSRTIKPRRDDTLLSGWEPAPDQAPSIVREEQPTFARVLALVGLFLVLLGLIPAFAPLIKIERPLIEPATGFFSATTGLLFMLFHAFVDRERVFRRMYAYVGLLAIALAIILRVVPGGEGGVIGGRFVVAGFPALLLGLILLIATVRLETERSYRMILVNVLGGVGAVEILAAIGVGVFAPTTTANNFLAGEGGIHLIFGLFFLGAFIAQQDTDDTAHYAGLALAGVAALAIAGAVTRAIVSEGSLYLVPSGLILIAAGLVYLAVAAGVCLDWPIVVLTRRELSSYFYSPVAYLVLIGMLVVGWFMFWQFVTIIAASSDPMGRMGPLFEPILGLYIVEIIPVIVQIFLVPVITMRLLAEEQRTGTMEVLLTAPVNEPTVVISKFLAAWLFYLLTFVPWWANLIALRYLGETEFDYRPMLSFDVTLLAVSAGFISMGVFFSSLTRNQIIAAVLTFVGMIGHLAAYLIKVRARLNQGDFWYEVLTYISFIDVWWNSLEGVFAPRFLIFHLSVTVFFLYATIKVLEARRWA